MKQRDFLQLLEKEAQFQSRLRKRGLIPKQLRGLSSFVAKNVWQTCFVLAGFLAFWQTVIERGRL